jgi:hypothetical protein
MAFEKLFRTETGKIIMSTLLGLGLATLFRKGCVGRNCIEFAAPSLEDIKKKVYKYGDRCFKYKMETHSCDNRKKNVNFA